MTNPNEMINSLPSLNEKEIDFIGNERYKIISKVYLEDKTPADIKKEYHYTDDDLRDILDNGYIRLIKVIFTRLGRR